MVNPENIGRGEQKPSQHQLKEFKNAIQSLESLMFDEMGIGLKELPHYLENGRLAIVRIYEYNDIGVNELEDAGPTYALATREVLKYGERNAVREIEFNISTYLNSSELDGEVSEAYFSVEDNGSLERIPSEIEQKIRDAGIFKFGELSTESEKKKIMAEIFMEQLKLIRQNEQFGLVLNVQDEYNNAMEVLREIQKAHGIEPEQS
jgi:hypothetical protein